MTKEEILKKAKCVLLPYFKEGEKIDDYASYYGDFIKMHETHIIDSDGGNDLYHTSSNEHHFTTKWIYENEMPVIFEILGIKFNPLDYKPHSKKYISNNVVEDYSYLKPLYPTDFEIRYNLYYNKDNGYFNIGMYDGIRHGSFEILTCDDVEDVANYDFFNKISPLTNYHSLYTCPHQCSVINNHFCNNGRKLFLSCDSHSIPMIPLLACYFETVVVMDNRTTIVPTWRYENEEFTDVLFVMSPINTLDKYIDKNM